MPDSVPDQLISSLLPTPPPTLLPATLAALHEWADRQLDYTDHDLPTALARLQPRFPYRALPPSAYLRYRLVSWADAAAYPALFATDTSPFVDPQFRTPEAAEAYVLALCTDLRFSWKRGGCDWLVYRQADGADAQPIGVLHLYDLSHEQYADRVPHCCVGYALAPAFRRQGHGREALAHLLAQAAALFGRTEARAISADGNLASEALLRRCGFGVLEARPATRYHAAETLWSCGLQPLPPQVH